MFLKRKMEIALGTMVTEKARSTETRRTFE